MNVCDVKINDLRVGQVVKFPAHWAVIVQIQAEVGGFFVQRKHPSGVGNYKFERYSVITYMLDNGRILTPLFHMNADYPMVDRVLIDYNLGEHLEGSEFFRFDKIVAAESADWKMLKWGLIR